MIFIVGYENPATQYPSTGFEFPNANWQTGKWCGLKTHIEKSRPLEKDPHPKTAGLMAEIQKSTFKHLSFTLAIFTGQTWVKGHNLD